MSQQGARKFLGDLVLDLNLQSKFKAGPDKVLRDYSLTQEEKATLKLVDVTKLGALKIKDLAGVLGDGTIVGGNGRAILKGDPVIAASKK